MLTASRHHDISCGHRVAGHETKCRHLHGHNYRITFECEGALDDLGRVIDFSVIKERLCNWLEHHWDHKFLMWVLDPMLNDMRRVAAGDLCEVRFNPTAENMARELLHWVGPQQLKGTGVTLVKVTVEETRKCAASAAL